VSLSLVIPGGGHGQRMDARSMRALNLWPDFDPQTGMPTSVGDPPTPFTKVITLQDGNTFEKIQHHGGTSIVLTKNGFFNAQVMILFKLWTLCIVLIIVFLYPLAVVVPRSWKSFCDFFDEVSIAETKNRQACMCVTWFFFTIDDSSDVQKSVWWCHDWWFFWRSGSLFVKKSKKIHRRNSMPCIIFS
jgi:hypothetical protein